MSLDQIREVLDGLVEPTLLRVEAEPQYAFSSHTHSLSLTSPIYASSAQTESPREVTVRILKGLIMATKKQLAVAFQEQNKAQPVGQLPDEVLLALFKARLQPSAPTFQELLKLSGFSDSGLRTYYDDLEKLRLVSHRWNSLITSSPTLWTETSCLHAPGVVITALQYSKDAPIHVRSVAQPYTKAGASDMYPQLVIPHSARWSSLELETNTNSPSASGPETYLKQPATALRSLSLTNGEPLSPELDLFAGKSPSLRHLDLKLCGLPWDMLDYSVLRTLSLEHVPIDIGRLSRILSIASSLLRLRLRDNGTHFIPGPSIDSTMVQLPLLQSIHLDLPSNSTEALLDRIQASSLRSLIISDYLRLSPTTDYFTPWVRQLFGEKAAPQFLQIVIDNDYFQFLHSFQLSLQRPHVIPKANAALEYFFPILQKILTAFSPGALDSIDELDWSSDSPAVHSTVLPFIGRLCPNIATIDLSGCSRGRGIPSEPLDLNTFPNLRRLEGPKEVSDAWLGVLVQELSSGSRLREVRTHDAPMERILRMRMRELCRDTNWL